LFTPDLCEQINTDLSCTRDGEKPYSKAVWAKFKTDIDGKVIVRLDGKTHAYIRTLCMRTKTFRESLRAFVKTLIPDGHLDINFWDDVKEEKYIRGEIGFGFFIKRHR
jgi:hypothetical protein